MAWILDPEQCRGVADDARRRGVQGLLVPSAAFLDRPERWNIVIFAERVADLNRVISKACRVLALAPVNESSGSRTSGRPC
jgi:hypothetical protein